MFSSFDQFFFQFQFPLIFFKDKFQLLYDDQSLIKMKAKLETVPYFIEYNVTSIVRTWISQWFLAKKNIFMNNFTRINHCKFIHHKSHLKPFLSYLPCKVHREYFSIIINVKKCALYSIVYSTLKSYNHSEWHSDPS
jgi:hypothetical protein